MENQLLSWAGQRVHHFAPLTSNGDSARPSMWQPAVDVHEDTEKLLLVADLPGLEQTDIDLSVENNILTIRGERKPDRAGASQSIESRCERVQGTFSRAFTLPPTIDVEAINAEMKAGVLTVTLPKKAEVKPRQIKIAARS